MERLEYKIDVLGALLKAGFTTTRLVSERRMGNSTINALRYQEPVSMRTLGILCELLDCEPGDILVRKKSA